MPILLVVQLRVPPVSQERDLCRFRLAWDAPRGAGRQAIQVALRLPALTVSLWETLSPAIEVQERAALLFMARLKKEATLCLERGDLEGVRNCLDKAKRILQEAPGTPEMNCAEAKAFAEIEDDLASGSSTKFAKRAKYQAHQRRQSKPYP